MKILLIAAALALPCAAMAQGACSKADAAKAEKAVERVVSWPQLHKAFKDFRQCDEGPVDELFTETFIRLLVDWKNVEQLGAAAQDGEFKQFMFKHLKSPAAADDLPSVYSRVKTSCPSAQQALCTELADVAKPSGGRKDAPMEALEPLKPIGPKAAPGK